MRDPATLTWSQQAHLKASNAGAGDLFGMSVGVSDDTAVVGAPS
ncbi:MAG: FG-GAP repeat protein, partial [Verrucomicrobiota bacterium]